MFKNYIKVAFRNLYRNKIYSLINIFGLAIGLAATILLFLYVRFELSFDRHFKNSDKIYRIISEYKRDNGHESIFPSTIYELPDELKSNVPEVENSTRTWNLDEREIKINNISKGYHTSLLTDSCFFNVFSAKSIYGNNLENSLKKRYSVVLTESLAFKIFGEENPVGKVVNVLNTDMVVDDVIYDFPENTHLQFDYLISIHFISEEWHKLNGNSYSTYVLFNKYANNQIIHKTEQFISDYVNGKVKDYGLKYEHYLQALTDIHLNSNYTDRTVLMGNRLYIYIFSLLSFLILFIATLNYINLFTAKSETRLKEVGVRKVVGASKSTLLGQFIGESLIVSILSFLLAMLLVESFLEEFGILVNSKIEFVYSQNILTLVIFVLLAFFVGFLSGIYPALYIVKYNLINILKGVIISGKNRGRLKMIWLVIIQFTISIAIIASLFGLFAQVRYMKNKDLGFDKEQVIVFQALTIKVIDDYEAIKHELLQNPHIISITASQSIPGHERSGMNIRLPEWAMDEAIPLTENRVQDDYIKTYGLQLIAGEDYSKKLVSDSTGFILNEAAVKMLNLENPIGKKIAVWLQEGYIKGVVKNFHITSLHNEIKPMVLSHYSKSFYNISIRVQQGKIHETMNAITEVFKDFDPDYTQNYFFMDDLFDNMYKKEDKANKLILYASILTIIISLLGLLALTSYTVSRKTKEIGIRRALGSNVKLILVLLNKEILKWISISAFIGIPLSYIFLKNWLQNFAYRINPQIWFFIAALIIVIVLALITITVQSVKTAKKSPTELLRYE